MTDMNSDPEAEESRTEQFMRLFIVHQRRLYGLILLLVPNLSDADDLLQEVSTLMWQRFGQFQAGSDFAAWGRQFVRNVVSNYRRRQQVAGHVKFSDDLLKTLEDEARQAVESIDERHDALRACLASLPERARRLVELRYGPGASIRDVATTLGRSVEAAYKALQRIHADLHACVQRRMRLEGRS